MHYDRFGRPIAQGGGPGLGSERFPQGPQTGGLSGAEPLGRSLFWNEVMRYRPGRPQIAINHETIDANSQGSVVVAIKTSAPMAIEYIAIAVNDTPLAQLATVPIDITGVLLQTEWDQTEVQIINGTGNIMAVFGSNGVIEANYLCRMPIIHQGSEVTFNFTERGGVDTRIDVAMHGFLVTRDEMKEYMK